MDQLDSTVNRVMSVEPTSKATVDGLRAAFQLEYPDSEILRSMSDRAIFGLAALLLAEPKAVDVGRARLALVAFCLGYQYARKEATAA